MANLLLRRFLSHPPKKKKLFGKLSNCAAVWNCYLHAIKVGGNSESREKEILDKFKDSNFNKISPVHASIGMTGCPRRLCRHSLLPIPLFDRSWKVAAAAYPCGLAGLGLHRPHSGHSASSAWASLSLPLLSPSPKGKQGKRESNDAVVVWLWLNGHDINMDSLP